MVAERAKEPRSRVPMSRERVLEGAVRLADEVGIEALTMRRLARELGVEAMTLYYYVANKDEILNAIVNMVVAEIELPSPGEHWRAALRKTAISAHDVLGRHQWAASLMLSATGPNPARWRYMDSILGCLRDAGFSLDLTDHAYHALDSHITGYTLWLTQIQIDAKALPDLAARFLVELPAADYPHLVEHVEHHLKERDPSQEGTFAFGLDLILDGLERIRSSA